jgi:hypothetical protein
VRPGPRLYSPRSFRFCPLTPWHFPTPTPLPSPLCSRIQDSLMSLDRALKPNPWLPRQHHRSRTALLLTVACLSCFPRPGGSGGAMSWGGGDRWGGEMDGSLPIPIPLGRVYSGICYNAGIFNNISLYYVILSLASVPLHGAQPLLRL